MDDILKMNSAAIVTPVLPQNPVQGMAYVPFQQPIEKLFSDEQGFVLGTLFPELNKPFLPVGGLKA